MAPSYLDVHSTDHAPAPAVPTVTGRVVEVDAESGMARLELADGVEMLAPVAPGLWQADAEVTVPLAGDGRPLPVPPPLEVQPGEEERPLVEVGPAPDTPGTALGQRLAGVDSATRALEQARQRLSDAQAQLEREIAAVDGQYTVSARTPLAADGVGKPAGAMWEYRADGRVRSRYIWTGSQWVDTPLHGATLADGTVAAAKIIASRELWAKVATFAEVTTQMLIAGHAKITGDLLAQRIQLATEIIAGDPAGTHALLDRTGLRVKRRTPEGTVSEVVRLGVSDTSDYLGVVDSRGQLLASIDDQGRVSAQDLAVSGTAAVESLLIESRPLEKVIDARLPRIISRVDQLGSYWYSSGQNKTPNRPYELFEFSVTNPFDRPLAVMIMPPTLTVYAQGAGRIAVQWWATANGAAPTSANIFEGASQNVTAKGDVAITLPSLATNIGPGITWRVRCAVMGTVAWNLSRNETVRSYLLSLGVDDTDYGARSDLLNKGTGGPPAPAPAPAPAKKRHLRTYAGIWGASFDIHGRAASAMDPAVVQGYGGGPQRMGMLGFQPMAGDLQGADILSVRVYLYYAHWWNNSGGVASIWGYHDKGYKPGSWNGTYAPLQKGGVPKPGGVWIDLPSFSYVHWKSGFYRGINLRAPNDSTDPQYYGYVIPDKCKIEVTYLK